MANAQRLSGPIAAGARGASSARVALVCLSGDPATTSLYRSWAMAARGDLLVVVMEHRLDAPAVSIPFDEIGADRPYALFGHGGSARVAYDAACRLAADRPAMRLFVARARHTAPDGRPTVNLPITAFVGDRDRAFPTEAAATWHGRTRALFTVRICDGDAGFLHQCADAVLLSVLEDLRVGLRRRYVILRG